MLVVMHQKRYQHISAKYAENYFHSQHMNKNSGSIVFNEVLPAMVVVMHQKRYQHISAKCAENYCQSQRMNKNSGTI
eukprot:7495391-Karenia_brevis.AAC.1